MAPASPTPATAWVDTHIHLLPGLDDGPATLEEAAAMAEAVIAAGTVTVVATPHANYQFNFDPARVAAARDTLRPAVGDRLRILTGCELHLSYENVQAALANPRLYSLNASRYILVEFPEYFEKNALTGVLQRFRDTGLVPLIAHPERNPLFQQHPEVLREYLRLGCLSQVTASSFTGRFGKRAEQFSHELLQHDQVHVVASDAHSAEQRPPRLARAHELISRERGAEVAEMLCAGNPLAMTQDRDLPFYVPPREEKKSWFARLRS